VSRDPSQNRLEPTLILVLVLVIGAAFQKGVFYEFAGQVLAMGALCALLFGTLLPFLKLVDYLNSSQENLSQQELVEFSEAATCSPEVTSTLELAPWSQSQCWPGPTLLSDRATRV